MFLSRHSPMTCSICLRKVGTYPPFLSFIFVLKRMAMVSSAR